MKRFKTFWKVIKRLRFEKIVIGFVLMFIATSAVVTLCEPEVTTFRDAVWYTFVACTTIGFGDISALTFPGRIFTILITVYEIVLVALLSGVIVSYYLEIVKIREKEAIGIILDKLEHLTELSPEELKEIEKKAREIRN